MNRRKIRKYRSSRRNSGVKFLGILGIMIIAVICGYMTARFVIAPLLGYDTEVLKLDFPSRLTSFFDKDNSDEAKDDEQDDDERQNRDDDEEKKTEKKSSKDTASNEDGGYALQFGLFTTKDRAEELAADLDSDGIDTKIRKIDGKYKVISPLVDTKDEAVKQLKELQTDRVKDVFITVIE
ncbi:SPOR domain-containing protein [Ihubacter sp. mB4P-1]|uniref:SPOR domain-containing protein n=1 Tax=Ihubacter sp. mB4P-1 TaxID=3242370 RepID=UPI00137950EF